MAWVLIPLLLLLYRASASVAPPAPKRVVHQYNPPWALQAISNRDPANYNYPYQYDDTAGSGI